MSKRVHIGCLLHIRRLVGTRSVAPIASHRTQIHPTPTTTITTDDTAAAAATAFAGHVHDHPFFPPPPHDGAPWHMTKHTGEEEIVVYSSNSNYSDGAGGGMGGAPLVLCKNAQTGEDVADFYRRDNPLVRFNRAGAVGARCLPPARCVCVCVCVCVIDHGREVGLGLMDPNRNGPLVPPLLITPFLPLALKAGRRPVCWRAVVTPSCRRSSRRRRRRRQRTRRTRRAAAGARLGVEWGSRWWCGGGVDALGWGCVYVHMCSRED